MAIVRCNCKVDKLGNSSGADFQNMTYGLNVRVANPMAVVKVAIAEEDKKSKTANRGKRYRCTVCSKTHDLNTLVREW